MRIGWGNFNQLHCSSVETIVTVHLREGGREGGRKRERERGREGERNIATVDSYNFYPTYPFLGVPVQSV